MEWAGQCIIFVIYHPRCLRTQRNVPGMMEREPRARHFSKPSRLYQTRTEAGHGSEGRQPAHRCRHVWMHEYYSGEDQETHPIWM